MKPRLGFLGVGWIGRHRMERILESGAAEVAAVGRALAARAQIALRGGSIFVARIR